MKDNSAIDSVKALSKQVLQAWKESAQIKFPESYAGIENAVICGMGASGLPGHIIISAFQTKIPVALLNDYHIPSWAGPKTLVFLSSYSGDTEETISCFKEARDRGCLITGTTTGGELGKLLTTEGIPFYKYDPKHNPSGQARMGLGYEVFGQLGILHKLGVLDGVNTLDIEVTHAIEDLRGLRGQIEISAQKLVQSAQGNIILVLAAEHLIGNAHTFANQLNETSKNLAAWFALPEVNHHLLEGLKNPKVPVLAIFLDSSAYSAPIKKRLEITQDVVEKNDHKTYVYKPTLNGKLGEVMELLVLSSFTTVYLAEIYGENPLEIPWVDYFKKRLQEP